jgi:hypothetical protein
VDGFIAAVLAATSFLSPPIKISSRARRRELR